MFGLLRERHPGVPCWEQQRQMPEAAREAFLARFTPGGQGIGFAVLGGAFAEGIDLPGERLIGAFIATLGLPQVNPVNEQIRARMEAAFAGRGYDYTYLYPGLQKVVQAAGRVIRSPGRRGRAGADGRPLRPRRGARAAAGLVGNEGRRFRAGAGMILAATHRELVAYCYYFGNLFSVLDRHDIAGCVLEKLPGCVLKKKKCSGSGPRRSWPSAFQHACRSSRPSWSGPRSSRATRRRGQTAPDSEPWRHWALHSSDARRIRFTLGGCCAWTAGTDRDWTMHGCAARRCVETKAFKVGIGFGVPCAGLS